MLQLQLVSYILNYYINIWHRIIILLQLEQLYHVVSCCHSSLTGLAHLRSPSPPHSDLCRPATEDHNWPLLTNVEQCWQSMAIPNNVPREGRKPKQSDLQLWWCLDNSWHVSNLVPWALMGFDGLCKTIPPVYTRITLSVWGWPIQSSSNCDIRHRDRAWTEVPRLVQGLPWSHQLSGLRLSLLRLQPGPSGPGLDPYRTIFQRCRKLQKSMASDAYLGSSRNSTFSTFQFCLVVDDCDAVNPLGQERSLMARAKNQGTPRS